MFVRHAPRTTTFALAALIQTACRPGLPVDRTSDESGQDDPGANSWHGSAGAGNGNHGGGQSSSIGSSGGPDTAASSETASDGDSHSTGDEHDLTTIDTVSSTDDEDGDELDATASETVSGGDDDGDEIGGEDESSVDMPGDDCSIAAGPDCPCRAADLLFVIDNSVSMAPYQLALAEALPGFVATLDRELPAGVSIHAGATSTEMGYTGIGDTSGCSGLGADLYYQTPDVMPSGRPAAQGRLVVIDSKSFVEFTTGDDAGTLDAAAVQFTKHVLLGTSGSNVEMASASAGWAADPAVDSTNDGFIRDEGALLAVVVIQDEPDQTPNHVGGSAMLDKLRARKQGCGGLDCILGAGLVNEGCLSETPLGEFFGDMTIPAITGQLPPASEDIVGAIEHELLQPLALRIAEQCERRNR